MRRPSPLLRAAAAGLLALAWACSSGGGGGGTGAGHDARTSDGFGFGGSDVPSAGDLPADGSPDAAAPPDTPGGADLPRDPGPDTAPPPPGDRDGDQVPDLADPFPDDPDRPGVSDPNEVYAHTSSALFTVNSKTYKVARIGAFRFDSGGGSVTDLAIDRYGVLYGITFDDAHVCHPETARCWRLGALANTQFNGLSFVPAGLLEPDRDVLVGMTTEGDWYRLDVVGSSIRTTRLGAYGTSPSGTTYRNAGDAFSIRDVGTFAAVKERSSGLFGTDLPGTKLVEVDPRTGRVLREVGPIQSPAGGTFNAIYGLAGGRLEAMAFDEGGDIVIIEIATGRPKTTVAETPEAWWGAGVRTLAR